MRYMVRQKMFSIGSDFWITDEQGNQVFFVDGKALSVNQRLDISDPSGTVLASVHKKVLAMTETLEVERDGALIATVRRQMFSPLHHRSSIELGDGTTLEAVGNLTGREFDVKDGGGQTLARISRAWFTVPDTYGVEVMPGQDDALMLAIAVCLDRIHHNEEERRSSFPFS